MCLRHATSGSAAGTQPKFGPRRTRIVITEPQSGVWLRDTYIYVAEVLLHLVVPFSAPSVVLFVTILKPHLVHESSTAGLPEYLVRSTGTIFDLQKGHHKIPYGRSYRMILVAPHSDNVMLCCRAKRPRNGSPESGGQVESSIFDASPNVYWLYCAYRPLDSSTAIPSKKHCIPSDLQS